MIDFKQKPKYLKNQKLPVDYEKWKAILAGMVFLGSLILVAHIDKL